MKCIIDFMSNIDLFYYKYIVLYVEQEYYYYLIFPE